MTNINDVLQDRGRRYGAFDTHATITQELKKVAQYWMGVRGLETFAPDHIEAMDMIFHKLGRILNGDPNYADSWVDIAGYAKLVADRLQAVPVNPHNQSA